MKYNRDHHEQHTGFLGIEGSACISLAAYESHLERILRQAVRESLQQTLAALEEKDPAPTTLCRWCGNIAHYNSNRKRYLKTRFGLIPFRRAYYVCIQCQHSTCPLDERLDPYASLARLRERIVAGNLLPIDQMAKAWGLGSLEIDAHACTGIIAKDMAVITADVPRGC